MKQVVFNYCR